MIVVDESSLDVVDRLGLAYCRLNSWEWDDICGPKPDGFDDLPDVGWGRLYKSLIGVVTKSDYIRPKIQAIVEIIGRENTSRCWWMFVLGETEDAWREWYKDQKVTGQSFLTSFL